MGAILAPRLRWKGCLDGSLACKLQPPCSISGKNRWSVLNIVADVETLYLVNRFYGVTLVHAKTFDGEQLIEICIGVPPNISESSRSERKFAGSLHGRGGDYVGIGKDPM